ncbi:MAG: prepilin-type N-terminal cleavage/methylation domain-containing protein [Woeseiaceae bacterium]|nr:prepilin-type N-terminal cleavage/methylation domain-containing protein [Woeseiaceae bacterium]
MLRKQQSGLTLVELMVALAIGSFLIIGAVQIYNQSRQAFVVNESIARVQETAQFAMDTIEADLRMASNWGRTSRSLTIDGRSLDADPNPNGLAEPLDCGAGWALDLAMIVDGDNNGYAFPCAATGGAQANSDSFTVRRATVDPVARQAGRLQIQTTRIQGVLMDDGLLPPGFVEAFDPITGDPLPGSSTTHNLLVNSYYVSADSDLIPGVPTLRRKTLGVGAGGPAIVDQEIAPGVENLQIQLGIDVDEDNTVDRYVNPGDPVYDPAAAGFIPGARVMTARIWLVVRGVTAEVGIQHTRNYDPGDINLGVPNDAFRRVQVSKTILLRNARI